MKRKIFILIPIILVSSLWIYIASIHNNRLNAMINSSKQNHAQKIDTSKKTINKLYTDLHNKNITNTKTDSNKELNTQKINFQTGFISNPDNKSENTSSSIKLNSSNLTLFINEINNLITSYAVLFTIITIFIGCLGILSWVNINKEIKYKHKRNLASYKEFDSDIREYTNTLKSRIDEGLKEITKSEKTYNDRIKEFSESMKQFNELENKVLISNKFSSKAIDTITNQTIQIANTTKQQELLDIIINQRHTINLINPDKIIREQALLYFKEKGTKQDILELEEVYKSDAENRLRSLAKEIIGMIKERGNLS